MRTSGRWAGAALSSARVGLLGAAVLTISVVTAADASQRGGRCLGGTTVAVTPNVRVSLSAGSAAKPARYYACDRRTGRKTHLSRRYTSDFVYTLSRFRFAGGLIAYQRSAIRLGTEEPDRVLVIRSLRDGRQVRRLAEGKKRGAAFIEYERRDGIRDMVLTAAGDIAWIVQNPFALAPPQPNVNTSSRTTEAYAASRGAAPMLLDQGRAISQTSLTRRSCIITWSHGGIQRSARLCPG